MSFDREPAQKQNRKGGLSALVDFIVEGFAQAGAVQGLYVDPKTLHREPEKPSRWPFDSARD